MPLAVAFIAGMVLAGVIIRKATGSGKPGGEVTTKEANLRKALKRG